MTNRPHLYPNPDGFLVTRHSYSGSQTFNYCARKYQLERLAGWHEKQEKAARYFGTCVETAVKLAHLAGDLAMGADFFADEWLKYKFENLTFAQLEGSWAELLLSGQELMRLYAIFYPNTGFTLDPPPQFQVQDIKQFNGIEFRSYIDMLVQRENGEQVILDCKVSGSEIPKLVSLDPQLRSYAWALGVEEAGFLWFKKNSRKIDPGDELLLLAPHKGLEAGSNVYVLASDDSDVFDSALLVTPDRSVLTEIAHQFKGKKKAADVEAKAAFIREHGISIPEEDLTAQRISLATAKISEDSCNDIKRQIAEDILRIQFSNTNDYWPMQSGVRFPNSKCTTCPMRGICSGNDKLRDELVTRGKTLDKKGYDIEWGDE